MRRWRCTSSPRSTNTAAGGSKVVSAIPTTPILAWSVLSWLPASSWRPQTLRSPDLRRFRLRAVTLVGGENPCLGGRGPVVYHVPWPRATDRSPIEPHHTGDPDGPQLGADRGAVGDRDQDGCSPADTVLCALGVGGLGGRIRRAALRRGNDPVLLLHTGHVDAFHRIRHPTTDLDTQRLRRSLRCPRDLYRSPDRAPHDDPSHAVRLGRHHAD